MRKVLAVLGFCTGLVFFFFFNNTQNFFFKKYLNMPVNRLPLICEKYDLCFVLKHKCKSAIFKTWKLRDLLLKKNGLTQTIKSYWDFYAQKLIYINMK